MPTRDRSTYLREALASLAQQSLPSDAYEVVVIDDGSTDDTERICAEFAGDIKMRYQRIRRSGIAAAKNLGTFASTGDVLLFLDDDDRADPLLLETHKQQHEQNPDLGFAVLGYTAWAPDLEVTEVMRYVTDVGCILFDYPHLRDGESYDFRCFWGGRSSCKRSLLVTHGVFRQQFVFGCEDVELAYRLAKFGLRVTYVHGAKSYMIRPISYDEFCRRCERQGHAQYEFGRLHPEPEIQTYCQTEGAREQWNRARVNLARQVDRVHEIEALLSRDHGEPNAAAVAELHSLYRTTFAAFKRKGIVEAMEASTSAA